LPRRCAGLSLCRRSDQAPVDTRPRSRFSFLFFRANIVKTGAPGLFSLFRHRFHFLFVRAIYHFSRSPSSTAATMPFSCHAITLSLSLFHYCPLTHARYAMPPLLPCRPPIFAVIFFLPSADAPLSARLPVHISPRTARACRFAYFSPPRIRRLTFAACRRCRTMSLPRRDFAPLAIADTRRRRRAFARQCAAFFRRPPDIPL